MFVQDAALGILMITFMLAFIAYLSNILSTYSFGECKLCHTIINAGDFCQCTKETPPANS
jgi:hypothetical protein